MPCAIADSKPKILEDDLKHLLAYGDYPFAFRYDDAHSGGKSLALTKAGSTTATWRPPFGHVLPNWDFEIVEQPEKPGQYRWLEFSWKAASKETRGVTLRLGPHHGGGVALVAGEATPFESVIESKQSDTPPTSWQTVRVDLWKLHGKPFSVRSLSLVIPFCTWLMMGYFKAIPKELEECARIDGASRWKAMVYIIIPVAVPGILSSGIIAFTLSWNEFIYALVFLSSPDQKTVPVGVTSELIRGDVFFWGPLMAGALLGSIPVAIVYSFFVEHYVAGLTGSVKG